MPRFDVLSGTRTFKARGQAIGLWPWLRQRRSLLVWQRQLPPQRVPEAPHLHGGTVPSGYIDPAGNAEGEVRISDTQNGPAYTVGRSPNGGQIARASSYKSSAWVTLYNTGGGVQDYGFSCAATRPTLKAATN